MNFVNFVKLVFVVELLGGFRFHLIDFILVMDPILTGIYVDSYAEVEGRLLPTEMCTA